VKIKSTIYMSTPEKNAEIAVDESFDRSARENAIDELETANACEELSDIVLNEGIEEEYRELALTKLASPQCTATLRSLAENADLPQSMRKTAEDLLDNTPDSAGAGP
jgi:hypothetical protein